MPTYNISVNVVTIDTNADALLEVVERVAAALRPALPYGTAIEHTHVTHIPEGPDEDDTGLYVDRGDTIAIRDAVTGKRAMVGYVKGTQAPSDGPSELTVNVFEAS